MSTAYAFAKENASRFEAELTELLRIPSVSAQPEHADDVRRAAAWIIKNMQAIGLPVAETHEAPGCLPLVYGELPAANPHAPTVLVYCHYDVQPAAMEDGWTSDPFEPVRAGDKLTARGAVDSKSHVIAWLKAIESLTASGGAPVNIKLLFEGEEESDSRHIYQFVATNGQKLAADVIVISDGSMPAEDQPVLEYGLRGVVSFEMTVYGPKRDLHSGHYGGSVHNPLQALAEIIAQLHDENGRIAVPGFYDHVRPVDDEERAALSGIAPFTAQEWQTVTEAPQHWGDPDYALHERIMTQPTLELNGITGGYGGEGIKMVIPSKAHAKLSCRLVPHQDPARIAALVKAYVQQIAPPTVQVEFRALEDDAPGVVFDRGGAAMQAVAAAYEYAWGTSPLYCRAGGSIPVADTLIKTVNAPLVIMPFGYKGCGAHGPNEYVLLPMFHKGIAAALHFLQGFKG